MCSMMKLTNSKYQTPKEANRRQTDREILHQCGNGNEFRFPHYFQKPESSQQKLWNISYFNPYPANVEDMVSS